MSDKEGRVIRWFGLLVLIYFLASLFVPPITCVYPGDYSKSLTCTQLADIHKTLKRFYADQGTYPTTEEGLEVLVKNPDPQKYIQYPRQPYYERLPKDIWKQPFFYHSYKIDEFELISFGADKKYGGEEENADIVYPGCDKEKKEVGFFERVFK